MGGKDCVFFSSVLIISVSLTLNLCQTFNFAKLYLSSFFCVTVYFQFLIVLTIYYIGKIRLCTKNHTCKLFPKNRNWVSLNP